MTARDYRSVAARIRRELPELDRVAHRASRAWASASRDSEDLYVDAAALNIHGFYAGLERIFVLIAERIDGSLPSGPNWRQDLLRQLTAEMPGIRPAALTPDLVPAPSTGIVASATWYALCTPTCSIRDWLRSSLRTCRRPTSVCTRSSPSLRMRWRLSPRPQTTEARGSTHMPPRR